MFTSAIKTIGSRSGIGRRIEAQTEHVVYGSLRGKHGDGPCRMGVPGIRPVFRDFSRNHPYSGTLIRCLSQPFPAHARTKSLDRWPA